jgi:two-component system, NtrC family, nitrogen regulation sensor histidine kinase GlnL
MSLVSDKASDLQKSVPTSAEKMQRLDRLANLGMLSAGMAHEIKNGMVAIKTFVDLLLEKNHDAELGEVVLHELERINAIVTQMLRIAAPGHAAFKTVRVHEVLDHSLRLLQPQVSGKLITVKKNYRTESDAVLGDDAQLQQTFMNFFLNSLEAMVPNGTLAISTEIANGENGARILKIQIQDTGVGITPENLARLFEPFFTTKKNGTGLGLAICQRIIHEHHGSIYAQSESGKGSTFSISLPVSVE